MVNPNYSFTLDLNDLQPQIVLPIRTNGSKKLQISITNNGEPYQISKKCVAIFCATKSDGTTIVNNCTLEMVSSDTKICYETTPQTTASVGLLTCDIRLYEGEELVLTTPRFYILVDSRAVADENLVSKDEFGFLDSIILEEAERVSNEAERQLNEEARKNAMATVIDENSTHEQYASAKAAYEYGEGIRADILPILNTIQGENTVEEVNVWELDTGIYRLIGSFNYMQNTEFKPYNEIGGLVTTGVLIVTKNAWDVSWMLIGVTAMHGYQYYRGEVKVDGTKGLYTKIFQTVDSELDENSENPVQNKAIVNYLTEILGTIGEELERLDDEIDLKVPTFKVTGYADLEANKDDQEAVPSIPTMLQYVNEMLGGIGNGTIKVFTEQVNLWELETGIYYFNGGFKYTSTSGVGGTEHIVIIYRPQKTRQAVRYIHFCGGNVAGSWNSIDCGYTNGTTNEHYNILDTSSGYTKKEVDTLLETLKTELQGDIEDISALVGGAE